MSTYKIVCGIGFYKKEVEVRAVTLSEAIMKARLIVSKEGRFCKEKEIKIYVIANEEAII